MSSSKLTITGADFYEEFKKSLQFVGLGFHEMHLAKVTIVNGIFIVSYQGFQTGINFNQEISNGKTLSSS